MIRPPGPSSHQVLVLVRSSHGVGSCSSDLMSGRLVLASRARMVLVTVPPVCPTVVFVVVQAFGPGDSRIVLGTSASAVGFLGLVGELGGELFHQGLEFRYLFGLAVGAVHVVWWGRELCRVERWQCRWGPVDIVCHVWLEWLCRCLVDDLLHLGRYFI